MTPTKIKLHKLSKTLELTYGSRSYTLSAEYLRVMSPSAEVKGHGAGQEVLQFGKRHIGIDSIEPVGSYALKISFSDGHDTGLFTWPYLHDLAVHHDKHWQAYLAALHSAKKTRDADTSVVNFIP